MSFFSRREIFAKGMMLMMDRASRKSTFISLRRSASFSRNIRKYTFVLVRSDFISSISFNSATFTTIFVMVTSPQERAKKAGTIDHAIKGQVWQKAGEPGVVRQLIQASYIIKTAEEDD